MVNTKKKVLLVEDDPFLSDIYLTSLEKSGIKTIHAKDGNEALLKIEKGGFDLLLLDLHMPQMDGFEVGKRIQQSELLSGVKIILLTSAGQRGDNVRCREAGIGAYLPKPIKYSQLFKAIMSVLGQKTQEDATDKIRLITRHTIREEWPKQTLRILLAEDNQSLSAPDAHTLFLPLRRSRSPTPSMIHPHF